MSLGNRAFRTAVWMGLAALPLMSVAASAATITLGAYDLKPNQADQTIDIYASGGDSVEGVDLEVFTGDGGADAGGKISAPKISDIKLFQPGAIFFPNNAGYLEKSATSAINPSATESQFYEAATITSSGTVTLGTAAVPQLLAEVTIDTTGFTSGSYAITLDNPASPSSFIAAGSSGPQYPTVTAGTIDIASVASGPIITNGTPEPATLGLLGLVVPTLLLRRRRSSAC